MKMSETRKHFDKYMKEFMESTLKLCDVEVKKNPNKYLKIVKKPIFKNDRLSNIETIEILDYAKIIHNIKNQIKKYPEINSLLTITKNIFKKQIQELETQKKLECYKVDNYRTIKGIKIQETHCSKLEKARANKLRNHVKHVFALDPFTKS